jgi:catechol 2,3-dioxygenase-like lactoylglutathione lyase family enzyme
MVLGQAMIFVSDMGRMQRFYRDLLGLAVIEESAGFARYAAGGAQLALHAIPAAIAATFTIADPPVVREDAAIKLTFVVDDLAATRARLSAAGVTLAPVWSGGGLHACNAIDPEGNVLQLAQPTSAP